MRQDQQQSHQAMTNLDQLFAAPFDLNNVEQIYVSELRLRGFERRRLQQLELSQYLELYIWPNYNPQDVVHRCSIPLLMSCVLMINEKFREQVPIWQIFQADKQRFHQMFAQL